MQHKPAVRFIFFTVLLEVLGFGLLIPVGPHLVEHLLHVPPGTEPAKLTAMAAPYVGWLMATYAIFQFGFSPILGSLSDRFGRRPVILISLLGSALDYFASALAPTLLVLFITRALNGVSGASIAACNAYVADVTPPKERAAGFGMLGAAFGLGFVIGPLLGGWLGSIDIRLPFWGAGVLTLINFAYGWFVLPESLPPDKRRPFSLKRANPLAVFVHLTRYPIVMGLGAALFFINLAQFALHSTWVLYTNHRYGWDELATGFSLTIVGIGAAVVQGGLAGRIIKRTGEPLALLAGLGLGICAYVGYGIAPHGWMIYAIIAFASLGGVAGPASQAIITRSIPPTEQGEVQGALGALNNVALIAGPVMGATVFSYFISAEAPFYLPGASMFLSAVLSFVGLGVSALVLARFYHVLPRRCEPTPQN
jgi:DHA1 family tetracycline resistance protein-like MFS transporter